MSPFYVVLNAEKQIQEWGSAIGKLCPDLKQGRDFEDYFEVKKHAFNSDERGVIIKEKILYFVSVKVSGIKIKGQFIITCDELFLFVCNPLIEEMRDISSSVLELSDFPLHHYLSESVFLLNEFERSSEEIDDYSEKLEERSIQVEEQHQELLSARRKLEDANAELESRVKERTKELEESNTELSQALNRLQSTQEKLVESEKLAALGQLVSGIAHEINTPMGAIKASIELIHKIILEDSNGVKGAAIVQMDKHKRLLFEDLIHSIYSSEAYYSSREERRLTKELRQSLEQYDVREASYIASAMRDIGYLHDLERYFELFKGSDALAVVARLRDMGVQNNMARNIKTSISKVDKIVSALKTYITDQTFHEKREVNLIESIDNVLTLHRNSIKQGVEVHKSFTAEKFILSAYADELNQVWVNLIHNSLQAMENQGVLNLSISHFEDLVFITIQDNGPGIPHELQRKVFEPFFTTKKGGQGTGLGLALVQKIIQQHGGEIDMESEPGKTTFTIAVPGLVRVEGAT